MQATVGSLPPDLCAPTLEAENSVRLFGKSKDGEEDFVNAMDQSIRYLQSVAEKVI